MKAEKGKIKIEKLFRKKVQKSKHIKNACLLVHSDKLNIHCNLHANKKSNYTYFPDEKQPIYMSSAGKLFTSTLTGILFEQGKLSYDDFITEYLDEDLTKGLHVYKGTDYSSHIKIRHLLNHTSGLNSCSKELFEEMTAYRQNNITAREVIIWTKENSVPVAAPGKKMNYSDTNYHLLGLIIESICNSAFHEAMHKYIFNPLDMKSAFMLHYSKPLNNGQDVAGFYANGINLVNIKNYAFLDYAAGGVTATTEDILKFMKALVNNEIIKPATFKIMFGDTSKFYMLHEYGYGIMKIKGVPLIVSEKYNSWGHAGETAAFMFYHPLTDSYIIGSFNNVDYVQKAMRFLTLKIIKNLSRTHNKMFNPKSASSFLLHKPLTD